MAKIRFTGQAVPVAQVDTVVVGGTINGETFQIKIGGVVIAQFVDTANTIAGVVAGLVSAFNASTHTYASGLITATDASPNVVLTSDIPGLAFEITLNTPGGSATFTRSTTTANKGPNEANDVNNYSTGALPGAGDTLILKDCAIDLLFGLESLTQLNKFEHHASHTGLIGLNYAAFWNGASYVTGVPEYRKCYFKTALIGSGARADIGINNGIGTPAGSKRLNLHFTGTIAQIKVHSTAATSMEVNRPAVKLLTRNDAIDAVIEIEQSAGGVGIGTEVPGEVCKVDKIKVGNDPANNVFIGPGVEWNEFLWEEGNGIIQNLSGTIGDLLTINKGNVEIQGESWQVVAAKFNGGSILDCSLGGVIYQDVDLAGSTYNANGSVNQKTWQDLIWSAGIIKATNTTLAIGTIQFGAGQHFDGGVAG
jgi:hypothetical protein